MRGAMTSKSPMMPARIAAGPTPLSNVYTAILSNTSSVASPRLQLPRCCAGSSF